MLTLKRVFIASIFGLLFGLLCLSFASFNPDPSAPALGCGVQLSTVLSRVLMGFMIGISAWKMKWWLHGIIMGAIASLPMMFAIMDNSTGLMWATFIMGIIYGFLIELGTTVVFKSPQR